MADATHSNGQLEAVLKSGHFAVTAETSPTATTDIDAAVRRAAPLKGLADAVNVTDGAGARAQLSPLVAAGCLASAGIRWRDRQPVG